MKRHGVVRTSVRLGTVGMVGLVAAVLPVWSLPANAAAGTAKVSTAKVSTAKVSTAKVSTAKVNTAKVNIVHGIPAVAVKVCVDGGAVVDNFRFTATVEGAALPAGTHRVRLVPAGKSCRSAAILQASFSLAAGRNYTLVANLKPSGTPNLAAFVNDVRPTSVGTARLTVRHAAQAPAVNVWAGSTRLVSGNRFGWGQSATLPVPAGDYRPKVTLPGSTAAVIGPAMLTFRAGRAYQIYAVGSPVRYRLVAVRVPVGVR